MLLDWIYQKFGRYHPAFIKGFISATIAILVFGQMFFNGDEAYKYVNPYVLFWLNLILGALAVFFNSIRDSVSAYYTAKDEEKKKNAIESGNTAPLAKDP